MASNSVLDENVLGSNLKPKSNFQNRSLASGGVDMASVRIKELQGA